MANGGLGTQIRARRGQTTELALPELEVSVKVRRPDVTGLIMESGRVPNFMLGHIGEIIGGAGAPDVPQTEADRRKQLTETAALVNLVVGAALVEPRVVDKPEVELTEDEVRIEDLPFNDRLVIFQWASSGGNADAARRFLEEQAADLAALQPGKGVPPDTGSAVGTDR